MTGNTRAPRAEITAIYGTAPAMVELTAFVAMANTMARSNVSLGIRAQGFSAACGLAPLAQPSVVASQA